MADQSPKDSSTQSTAPQQAQIKTSPASVPAGKVPAKNQTNIFTKPQSRTALLFILATFVLIIALFFMQKFKSPTNTTVTSKDTSSALNVKQTITRRQEPFGATYGTVTTISAKSIGIKSSSDTVVYPIASTVSVQKTAALSEKVKTVIPTGAKLADIKVGDKATLVFDQNTNQVFSIVVTQ